MGRKAALDREAQLAVQVHAKASSKGVRLSGLNRLKASSAKRSQRIQARAVSLVQRMAREELREIKGLIKKMHIVEAELIQQTSLEESALASIGARSRKDIAKGSVKVASSYDLTFPLSRETWFDELSNYNVDVVKNCRSRRAEK